MGAGRTHERPTDHGHNNEGDVRVLVVLTSVLVILTAIAAAALSLAVSVAKPRVTARSGWRRSEPDVRDDPADSGAWVTRIRNGGCTPLSLSAVSYDLVFRDPGRPNLHGTTGARVVAALREAGYHGNEDYYLLNSTPPGASLSVGADDRLAALAMPLARQLTTFAVHMTWRFGWQKIVKTIHLVQPTDPPQPLRVPLPDPKPAQEAAGSAA